jgi:hypothetical protein
MNELKGNLTLTKRLRKHSVWLREPPSYGQAWVDLLLLANDRDRATVLNGETVELKRGQLCWSQRALEREWNRSGEWIQRFLKFCRDESMILVDSNSRRTVITILNYDAYQPGSETVSEPGTRPDAEPGSETVSEPGRKMETGIGRGNWEGQAAEIPSDIEVRDYCAAYKDLAHGIEGIPPEWWTGWFAARIAHWRFAFDWKRALAFAHLSDWLNPQSPGHAKARFNLSARAGNSTSEKKSRRERGEILQELSLAQKNGATAAEIAALKEELKNDR